MPRRGTDVAAAANARIVQDVDYTLERRGWAMFARLSGMGQRGIAGQNTAPVIEPNRTFHGPLMTPQRFVGLAGLGRTVVEPTQQLGGQRSAGLQDPALRIFAERMRRRQ